ncbi:HEPN domain-containing protein [bacterium]|nr:HEPN domain-containing protein [bacterium]MBU1152539.1 HEPN domain-containing protein [bacterium]
MKTKRDLINNWIDKAEKDLRSVMHELSFSDVVTESVCFHCQQAVEKYLKAYLLFLGIPFTKTHEIGELITKCEDTDREIGMLKNEADKLSDYAVEVRYPDDWFEPALEDAKEALEIAKRIKEFVLTRIIAS